MTLLCDCESHMIYGFNLSRGPSPDCKYLLPTLNNSVLDTDKLLGDAGYDSENNHCICREDLNIRSFFPPLIGKPTTKPPRGYWRRKMKHLFNDKERIQYGQRWQVETVFSMIKRQLTSALSARKHQSRLRQMYLLILTHNIALFCIYLFYRA